MARPAATGGAGTASNATDAMSSPSPHDFAQQHRPSFMRPPAEPSAARWLLALVVVGAVAYGGYRYHEAHPDAGWPGTPPAKPATVPAKAIQPPGVTLPEVASTPPMPTTPAPAALPRGTAVTKCVGPAGVQYSDGPCPSGTQASQLHIHPRQNVADGLRLPPAPPTAPAPATAPVVVMAQPTDAYDPGATCEALNRRVEYLDQMARSPHTGGTQDWLRDQRKQARDEQFRLRCR